MQYNYSWQTALGQITAQCNDTGLTSLLFHQETVPESSDIHPILKQAQEELDEYFAGKRQNFTVPLAPQGTEFQLKVWEALRTIPYGKTYNYVDIAEKIAHLQASRAVGSACGANPIIIMIPCHRVIQKSGKIGNFTGGVNIKVSLLDLEKRFS